MKTSVIAFLVGALLLGSACSKQAAAVVLQDGLAANMSDEQILRALKLDLAKLQAKKELGPDGHSMIYSDAEHEIWITRSVVSGVIVMRMRPKGQVKVWELGKS